MKRKVLFIAPHPDDESLGCGGSIFKHKHNGDEIYWLIMTCGYPKNGNAQKDIKTMKEQIAKVKKMYEFDRLFELKFPTTLLDTIPKREMVSAISKVFHGLEPQIIYTAFRDDAHSDHKAVFDAVWSCTKSFRFPSIKEVYTYETVSETEFGASLNTRGFLPNTFQDITPFFKKKIEAVRLYESELDAHPFPRSERNIEALAVFRGATIGVDYAEAFMCLKRIL